MLLLGLFALFPNDYKYNNKEMIDDLGLNMLDYGARLYDPLISRWNGVDALAESYASSGTYNYVLGNPVRNIDPDGMRTLYVGESGLILSKKGNNSGLVNDPLPDAITIIPREKEFFFLAQFYSKDCGDPTNVQNAMQYRAYGVSYDVGSIRSFTERASKEKDQTGDYYEKNAKGNFVPAKIEVGNYLYHSLITNTLYVGGTNRDLKGMNTSPAVTSFVNSEGSVAKVHYHPSNATERSIYVKQGSLIIPFGLAPGDKGPSNGDDRHTITNGIYNIVTGANGYSGNSVYFYGNGRNTIEVPLNIFSK